MPCDQGIRALRPGPVQQAAKLDVAVAGQVRIGGLPSLVAQYLPCHADQSLCSQASVWAAASLGHWRVKLVEALAWAVEAGSTDPS